MQYITVYFKLVVLLDLIVNFSHIFSLNKFWYICMYGEYFNIGFILDFFQWLIDIVYRWMYIIW
jgi:hypothetical protein